MLGGVGLKESKAFLKSSLAVQRNSYLEAQGTSFLSK